MHTLVVVGCATPATGLFTQALVEQAYLIARGVFCQRYTESGSARY
jgi:hypothetical protein